MVEETKVRDSNTKTQLSLAAALFFSPLVQYILKHSTWDINDQERNFIRGYVRLGYIILALGLITVSTGIANYLFVLDILNMIYTVSIFILLVLLIISVVSILSDVSLLKGGEDDMHTYTIEGNKKDIILKYLPLYNIYLRYQAHNFQKPNRWIKESILLWTLFAGISIMGSIRGSTIILILIIIRVASLMLDIDIIDIKIKKHINKIFLKNPEELRGYLTGFLRYLYKSLIHLFIPTQTYSLDTEIQQEQEAYGRIITIHNNSIIIIEYLIGLGILILFFALFMPDFTVRTYYAGWGLFLFRYLIMVLQLKHLPHLPIAREIMLLLRSIGSLFQRKSFTPNP